MLALEKSLHQALPKVLLLLLYTSAVVGAPTPQDGGVERWTALADTVFQHLARDDEMPNSAVATALTQDAAGFVWVGTQNGLARWDGYRFRTYQSDPARPDTLPENSVFSLYTDSRGRLWIGTSSRGLARYDYDHDRFVRYPTTGPNGISHFSVRDIAEDGAGGIWVATEGGLDQLSPETGAVTHFRHDESDPDSLPDDQILAVWRSRDGTLWVGTDRGLVRRGPGDRAFVPVPLPTSDAKVTRVRSLFEDTRQRLWIGTRHQGAYVIEPKGTVATRILESDPEHSTLQTDGVIAITEVRPGEIWLGTINHGIIAVNTVSFRTHRIQHDPISKGSLADGPVYAMLKDRSGLVWICTTTAISRYDPGQSAIHTIFGESSRPDGLTDSAVWGIFQPPDGRVWLGLEKGGIDVVDPAGVRTGALRSDLNRPETALPDAHVHVFARAESGDVYVGTRQGLYRVDPLARHATRLTLAGRDPSLPVVALLLRRGVLWVGGIVDGLWEVDLGSTREAHTALPARRVDGLSDRRATAIAQDSAGSLWIGTGYGLNHFDPTSGAIEHILPDAADPSALAAGEVTALLTDRRGRLWVGTSGGGINVMEGRDHNGRPRFHRLGVAQGLANDNVDMLLADPRGQIWASTDNGLAVIDPASFTVRTLRRAEGVMISNYDTGSGAVTDAGELLFGGAGGLTVVQPERLNLWRYQPPVVVTDVRVGGKAVPSSYLNLSGPRRPLTITPGANSISVEFSALDYSAPERNRYAYQLEGFDTDWTESEPSRRLAAYTNLPPGDYLLRLRGSNREGVWSHSELTVPIRVLPAWFQTLAFKALAGLALLGLLAMLYQLRIRSIEKSLQERHLTRLAERERIARELHDTLLQGVQGLILRVQAVIGRISQGDPARALILAEQALSRADGVLVEGRNRIKDLRTTANDEPDLPLALAAEGEQLVLTHPAQFRTSTEGAHRDLHPMVREEVFQIAREALGNAFRHSGAQHIEAEISYGEAVLDVRIRDDGRGIGAAVLEAGEAPGHFGLLGMRERAGKIPAQLKIWSKPGAGTEIHLQVPAEVAYRQTRSVHGLASTIASSWQSAAGYIAPLLRRRKKS
jgi:ligand-binding sensor domain-containing protein/signal transduction histidine kinase